MCFIYVLILLLFKHTKTHKRIVALTMGLRAAAFLHDRSGVQKRVATRWTVNGQVICLLK